MKKEDGDFKSYIQKQKRLRLAYDLATLIGFIVGIKFFGIDWAVFVLLALFYFLLRDLAMDVAVLTDIQALRDLKGKENNE